MGEFGARLWPLVACILVVCSSSVFNAAAYGSSVEDLVGVFSIQKTIKLGSSSECFSGSDNASDSLDLSSSSLADNQPPSLVDFNLEPKVVESSSSSQAINLTAHVIDDNSGLSSDGKANLSAAWFKSPSGQQIAAVTFQSSNLTSGSIQDGIYSTVLTLPQNSEAGAWQLVNLTLIDKQGNRRVLCRDDLVSQGFPAEFLVT